MYGLYIYKNSGIIKRITSLNKVIGVCNFKIEDKCYITNLFVNENFRKNNIGSCLINKLEDYIVENDIDVDNITANINMYELSTLDKFYIKNGFKLKQDNPDIHVDCDGVYNIFTMEKYIK